VSFPQKQNTATHATHAAWVVSLQYKMIAPESATDAKIWKCYCDCDGDDDKVQETIGSW
jgi:hypothetical protein